MLNEISYSQKDKYYMYHTQRNRKWAFSLKQRLLEEGEWGIATHWV